MQMRHNETKNLTWQGKSACRNNDTHEVEQLQPQNLWISCLRASIVLVRRRRGIACPETHRPVRRQPEAPSVAASHDPSVADEQNAKVRRCVAAFSRYFLHRSMTKVDRRCQKIRAVGEDVVLALAG